MEKKEVVINCDYGGFSISREAFLMLRKMKNEYALSEADIGEMWSDGSGPRELLFDCFCNNIARDNKDLIEVVKKLGEKVNGEFASLKIVEIPSDMKWHIEEYDGLEHVAEDHRKFY